MTDANPERTKWEYKELTRKTSTFFANDLNEAGKEGWELVSVTHHEESSATGPYMAWTGLLKRPYTDETTTEWYAAGHESVFTPINKRFEASGIDEEIDDADDDFEFKFAPEDDDQTVLEAEVIPEKAVPPATEIVLEPQLLDDDDDELKLS